MDTEVTNLIPRPCNTYKMTERRIKAALNMFGIDEDQVDSLSLAEVKKLVRERYVEVVFRIHPDQGGKGFTTWIGYLRVPGGTRVYIEKVKEMYQRIKSLKHKPMTTANCAEILEITKGYKTTEDVDFGLNGFI